MLHFFIAARRIPRSEREDSVVLSATFISGDLLVLIALMANAFAFGVVWPYLAAIIRVLIEAAAIFTRLVVVPAFREPVG